MKKDKLMFRSIAYQEKDNSFTGVCLDLDIIEEGHLTLEEAILNINDAIESHLEAAAKLGYPKELLSRPAPKEYWDKLISMTKYKIAKPEINFFQFFTTPSKASSNLVYA